MLSVPLQCISSTNVTMTQAGLIKNSQIDPFSQIDLANKNMSALNGCGRVVTRTSH